MINSASMGYELIWDAQGRTGRGRQGKDLELVEEATAS
jgi:hypothetical protein